MPCYPSRTAGHSYVNRKDEKKSNKPLRVNELNFGYSGGHRSDESIFLVLLCHEAV